MYAIFYKEWIKTRWYFLLAVLATLGFTGYCMLRINRVVEMKGAAHVWEVMLQRDVIFIDMLQYIPLIAGILMAIVQFVPEMQRKCLKLTLHLPYPELKMTGNMLLSGLILLLVCFASNFLLMEIYLNGILAHELKNHILLTALTWYLAGISGYLLVAWICLEPAWKRRILNRSIVTPNLLPVAYTESIQQVSPLFSGLYFVDSLFLVALYRTVQGRKTGLTNKKIKDLKLKD